MAILGRSYTVLRDAFERLLARLPFPILELHPDNGGEFFNHFLLTYWKQAVPHLSLSRTRPYRKNDNPFVEEKNGSLVVLSESLLPLISAPPSGGVYCLVLPGVAWRCLG